MTSHPLRLQPGEDLKQALDELARTEGWSAAIVLTGIGSLSSAAVRYADRDEAEVLKGPLEILSLAGTLSPDGSHLHLMVSDEEGRCQGGHLKEGSIIRTTAEIVIGVLPDWAFAREPDPETGYLELRIRPR